MFQDNRTKTVCNEEKNEPITTRKKSNDRICDVCLNFSLYSRFPSTEEAETHLHTLVIPMTFHRQDTELLKMKDKRENKTYTG